MVRFLERLVRIIQALNQSLDRTARGHSTIEGNRFVIEC